MQISRVPSPDGLCDQDGRPVLALPHGAAVQSYRLSYRGPGGSGLTYLGETAEGVRRFIKEADDSRESERLALERESTYLSRLHHPGIVKFYDLLRQDGHSYLVVELLEGLDLAALTARQAGFFPESSVLDWALQIVAIFRYLHAQEPPIIYRDLKPNNLMCAGQRIVLIDFGSVRHFKKDKTKDTNAFGTVATASPEHYGGQTDERSDIYCFGATLHYLLTKGSPGKFFFDLPPIPETNPEVSSRLCRVVERCTRRKSEERYQTFSEVETALTDWERGLEKQTETG